MVTLLDVVEQIRRDVQALAEIDADPVGHCPDREFYVERIELFRAWAKEWQGKKRVDY